MAKAELDPDWWKKNAPKSIAGGQVLGALTEVDKKSELDKTGDHVGYFRALDKLKAAIAKDEQLANKAMDKIALTMLTELKAAAAAGKGKTEDHMRHKGDVVAKGLSGKSGVAVPELKGKS